MLLERLSEMWQEIVARPSGPMAVRFYLQPVVAFVLAAIDGVHDAREGRPAWLWAAIVDREHRRALLQHGWQSVGKVFGLAVVLDLVYQLLVLGRARMVETLLVATLLALLPYAVARGPVNRVVTALRGGRPTAASR